MTKMRKYEINYITWGNMPATTFVEASCKIEAIEKFYETDHAVMCMRFVNAEEVKDGETKTHQ